MNQAIAFNQMSVQDFAALGVQDVAYVKPVVMAGDAVRFAIHAADGTPVAVLDNREVAFAAVRQHGLEPVSLH
ncbi:MAG: DUF1150 family protein [Rhodospirillales bacterium]|nr:DUF1150 family protein [Rhodospirillales bacterium]